MRSRSALWESITKRGRFSLETKAIIDSTEYTTISAPTIGRVLMNDPLSVGNCNAASLSLSILTDDEIASSASVVIAGRVTDGTNYSEWKEFGTFFINQRDTSYEGLVTVDCYDAMLKANQDYLDPDAEEDDSENWPKTMLSVVEEIAYRIGVEVDPRTTILIGDDYIVPYPSGKTMIQVLGYIGACHGGNWIITEDNLLRLVPLITAPDNTNYIIDYDYNRIQTSDGHLLIHTEQDVDSDNLSNTTDDLINVPVVIGNITTGTAIEITGVSASDNGGNTYTAGDDSGFVLTIESNPYITENICNDLYASYNGLVYSPYTATKACYDPATELGDQVKIGDKVCSVIHTMSMTLDIDFRSDISTPNSEELSSEYPYLTFVKRLQTVKTEMETALSEAQETLTVAIKTTEDAITAEVTRATGAEETLSSSIKLTEESITAEVKRATEAEDTLSSKITQTADAITAEVTRATGAEETLSSKISVNAEAIESCVTKGSFGTYITQNYSYVRIAWNSYTKYIQFENAALDIYDSSETLLMKLNYTGQWFYYAGTTVGKIGTNYFTDYSDYRGLVFDLQNTGDYMTWAAQNSSGGSYITKLTWYRDDTIGYAGFNFSDYVYVSGYLRFNENAGFYNYTGDAIKLWSDTYVAFGSSASTSFRVSGDQVYIPNNVDIDFYSTLNLHGWGYTNDSDERLKTNIAPTQINGLDVINSIDLKEFDWIETGEHQAIGLIAQQILSFAPELIREDEKTSCLRLKTDQLVYYCIKAIQELCIRFNLDYQTATYDAPATISDDDKEAFVEKLHHALGTVDGERYNLPPVELPKMEGE